MRAMAWVLICATLGGCTFSLDWLRIARAKQAAGRRDYTAAVQMYRALMLEQPDGPRALTASRLGARVAHLDAKVYPAAVEFYKHIILRSPDALERKDAQKAVAQIYFENLQDFERSVIELEKMLKLTGSPEEAFRFRLNLAKSHLQLNNLDQATNELDVILAQKLDPDEIFEAKSLKANILVAAHRHGDAANVWKSVMTEFPERAAKENVALNLVVCYEEVKDFGSAIEVLEGMKADYPNPDFLNTRIARLKERQANQPGAQGWKR